MLFYPPKIPTSLNFENEKIYWRHHHFIKNHNHMIYGSWDTEWDRQNFLSFWGIFYPFITPLNILKIKILTKIRKIHRDIILLYIYVYHKWISCDIWFLKYKERQTEIFVILGHFLLFQHPDNLENQNSKIEKNIWWYYHFTRLHHNWQLYDVWLLIYGAWRTQFFVILNHFSPYYHCNNRKNQNFGKLKKKKNASV